MAQTLKLPNAALPTDLDCLAAVVLANLPSCTDDQRDGLSAGTHAVDLDVRLRIRGELAVSISTMTTQANLLPWQEMAMLLANKLPQAVVDALPPEYGHEPEMGLASGADGNAYDEPEDYYHGHVYGECRTDSADQR